MAKANEKYYRGEMTTHLVSRFESMLQNNTQYYFDISEFENLIDFYIEDSDVDNAAKVIEFACAQHPKSTLLQLKNAQVLFDNGLAKRALQIAIDLEKIEPSEIEIYLLQANCYLELQRNELADVAFNKAISQNSLKIDEIYHEIGYIYLNHEKYDKSLKYLARAVELNGNNFQAIFDLAYVYFLKERYIESIVFYKQYLKKYPLSEQAWNNLGNVFATIGNHDLAIDSFNNAISIDAAFQNPYLAKAEIHFSLGEFLAAIDIYKELIDRGFENNSLYFLIADCYQNLEENLLAIKYYKKSIEKDPFFADAWYSIAFILFKLEYLEKARLFIEKAIELDRSEIEFWVLAARIEMEIGTLQRTVYYFKKAIELDVKFTDVWLLYSEYFLSKGFVEEGVTILEEAVQYNKSNAVLYYALALFYNKIGNDKLAVYHFQVAVNLDFNIHEIFFVHSPELAENKKILEIVKTIANRNLKK